MIKLNNKTIGSAFLGSTPISKIYKGSLLIYQQAKDYIEVLNLTDTLSLFKDYYKQLYKQDYSVTPNVLSKVTVGSSVYYGLLAPMFYEADTVVSVDFSNYEVYTAGGFKTDSLFYRCSNLTTVKGLGRFLNDMFDYGLHTHSIGGLFLYCSSLTDVGDLNDFDVSIFDSVLCAFQGCSSIKTLDLSKWNTSNATNMNRVFQGCSSLENLYIDKFDTSSVEYSSSYGYYVIDMFKDCTALKKIRCTQSFKDYCILYQNLMSLPASMREGGSGVWEIVD